MTDAPKTSTNARYKAAGPKWIKPFIWIGWKIAKPATRKFIKRLFFKPRAYSPSPQEQALLDEGTPHTFAVHNYTVHYTAWGEGPAVLLAHGWNGAGIQLHHFIAPLREAGFKVIAVDAPAHGQSSGDDSSYYAFSKTIQMIIGKESIRGIVAHSFGASSAVNALDKTGAQIPVALFGPPLYMKELLYATFTENGIPASVFREMMSEYVAEYGWTLDENNPTQLIRNLTSPILICHDEGDQMIPLEDSQIATRGLAHVTLHETAGLGHKQILTDADTIAMAVEFLKHHTSA